MKFEDLINWINTFVCTVVKKQKQMKLSHAKTKLFQNTKKIYDLLQINQWKRNCYFRGRKALQEWYGKFWQLLFWCYLQSWSSLQVRLRRRDYFLRELFLRCADLRIFAKFNFTNFRLGKDPDLPTSESAKPGDFYFFLQKTWRFRSKPWDFCFW